MNPMTIFVMVMLVILVVAGIFAFQSWGLMILWGAIMPHFGVPSVGFPLAVLITCGLWFIGGFFKAVSK